MTKLYRFFYTTLFIALSQIVVIAQCPTCSPDTTCISEIEGPAVCPLIMPSATSGEYYEEVLTFYLPAEFYDEQSGQDVILNQVIITNVTGLPFGMEFTLNNDDATYYPQEGENHGCATICGTPILAGEYNVSISVHVFVEVFGFELEFDNFFINPLTVLQGEGGNSSFTYDINTGCGTVTSDFEALIAPEDQIVDWNWDFDNGNTSTDQSPTNQTFNSEGEYTVSLTTQLWQHKIVEVVLVDLDGDWYGDIDEPIEALSSPDPYFVIINGEDNIVFSSTVAPNTYGNTWFGLDIILNNPPYSIEFYDDDDVSDDDFLASFDIPIDEGYQNYDDGSTNGLIQKVLEVSSTFYDEEIISVFPIPSAELVVDEDNNIISVAEDTLNTSFIWMINDETGPSPTSSIEMVEGGVYYCIVSNSFGCSTITDEYIHCPEFLPEYDVANDALIVDSTFTSFQWYFNGLPLENDTNFQLMNPIEGNYAIEITTDYGCDVLTQYLSYVGINEIDIANSISIYPNPSSGLLSITNTDSYTIDEITLFNGIGSKIVSIDPNNKSFDLSYLPQGLYFIHVYIQDTLIVEKWMKF